MIRLIYYSLFPIMIVDCLNPLYKGRTTNSFQNFYSSKNNYDFGMYEPKYSPDTKQDFAESPILIQGGSLQTWSYNCMDTEELSVSISSSGRPTNCDIELWNGPNNTPMNIKTYIENGHENPFKTIINRPNTPHTIAIRNTGHIEFPLTSSVIPYTKKFCPLNTYKSIIQGGALETWSFDGHCESVDVMIDTDGRPINTRIELMQGPNNYKQIIEVYSEDGYESPFWGIITTPGPGCVIRILNTATLEFPIYASVSENTV